MQIICIKSSYLKPYNCLQIITVSNIIVYNQAIIIK